MNFGLSEEQQMIVDTVRNNDEKEIYPFENEVEATGVVRKEVSDEIKKNLMIIQKNEKQLSQKFYN